MNKVQRIFNVIIALFMILIAIFLMLLPEDAIYLVFLFVYASMLLGGLQTLWYYFRMARHMVDGKRILYKGIILLDLSLITFAADNIPKRIMMFYLLVTLFLSGLTDILRGIEGRRSDSNLWLRSLIPGIVICALAVTGLFIMNDYRIMTILYGTGLIYSAIARIVTSLKPAAIVYVQ